MADVKQKVVRVDLSPMNPKIKCAQLECGHDVFVNRAPTVGKKIVCERCTKNAEKQL
jgi:formylmethanofuran dehydrogenase subunit E